MPVQELDTANTKGPFPSGVSHYIPLGECIVDDQSERGLHLEDLLKTFQLDGTEIPFSSIVWRTDPLYTSESQLEEMVKILKLNSVRRAHLSYWAEPTDFLVLHNDQALLSRFGSRDQINEYYADTTGSHVFDRWVQEYRVASMAQLQSVTFHLIDYFHIDGLWEFEHSRDVIVNAMGDLLGLFLSRLEKEGLLAEGPAIEVENAGFGLEYGAQTSDDFVSILDTASESFGKVSIGWDTNHLLHAIGLDAQSGRARFLLPEDEISGVMEMLEHESGGDYYQLCLAWLQYNIADPRLIDRVSSVHLSMAPKKSEEIFRRGKLQGKYFDRIMKKQTDADREDYGAGIVLGYYDAHTPMPLGMKPVRVLLNKLVKNNSQLALYHELKNNLLDAESLRKQFTSIGLL